MEKLWFETQGKSAASLLKTRAVIGLGDRVIARLTIGLLVADRRAKQIHRGALE
jgi:hypothetical protein